MFCAALRDILFSTLLETMFTLYKQPLAKFGPDVLQKVKKCIESTVFLNWEEENDQVPYP